MNKIMNELEAYSRELRSADISNVKTFYALLNQGMHFLRLTDKDIAHEFGASRPTVTRWRNGKNAPHPAVRKVIFNWLRKRTEKFIPITTGE